MSDFNDRPFVAGALTGIRSFKVDTYGRLTGVFHIDPWAPGENVAQCHNSALSGFFSFNWASLMQPVSRPSVSLEKAEPAPEPAPHQSAGMSCGCGFYAYFDTDANPYHGTGQVQAVVQGYGVATVGTRGFRSEKVKLLALIDDSVGKPWWKRVTSSSKWRVALWLVALTCGAVVDTVRGQVWWALGEVVAVPTVAVAYAWMSKWKLLTPNPRALPALVRENYPDLPVFTSISEALKTFPLTVPPRPHPDTDPDFWTRPVAP